MSGMKKALPWLIGAVLAVLAGTITAVTPTADILRAPFISQVTYAPEQSATATGRTVTATISDASFAERISTDYDDWEATGNWLVVTLAASAPHSEVDAMIELAKLRVGAEVFHASKRGDGSLLGEQLHLGIDTVGMLVFELPSDIRTGDAVLQLSSESSTPRLDDVIAFSVPLGELPTKPEIEIVPAEVAP